MKLKLLNTNKLKEFILNNTSQEDIFAYYLKCTISDINKSLEKPSYKIRNVIRNEDDPSISFIYRGNKLKCKDWGNNQFSGDCFHIAAKYLKKDINDKKDFTYVLYDIIYKVIYKSKSVDDDMPICEYKQNDKEYTNEVNPFRISFEIRNYSTIDLRTFNKWGLRYDTLIDNKVYPVDRAYFNGKLVYYFRFNDPCYAYYLGTDPVSKIEIYELYLPNREKGKKHWTNNIFQIKYVEELVNGANHLVITKSRKDCLLLRQIFKQLKVDEYIHVTQFHSESTILNSMFAQFLKDRYNNIYVLSDFDKQGRYNAYIHKKMYGFIPIYFTNGSLHTVDYFKGNGKDITDYTLLHNLQATIELVKQAIQYYAK